MRNAFRNHYIYTCAVGVLAFAWIFTRPPLDLSQPVPQPTATAAKADPTGQGVGKRGDQVTVVQPVTATSIINKTAPAPVEADDTISTAAIGQLAAPAARLLRVDADNLRMRSGPSSSTEPLGTYQRGTVLEELESQGQWSLVRNVQTGTIGWMFADYLASTE